MQKDSSVWFQTRGTANRIWRNLATTMKGQDANNSMWILKIQRDWRPTVEIRHSNMQMIAQTLTNRVQEIRHWDCDLQLHGTHWNQQRIEMRKIWRGQEWIQTCKRSESNCDWWDKNSQVCEAMVWIRNSGLPWKPQKHPNNVQTSEVGQVRNHHTRYKT